MMAAQHASDSAASVEVLTGEKLLDLYRQVYGRLYDDGVMNASTFIAMPTGWYKIRLATRDDAGKIQVGIEQTFRRKDVQDQIRRLLTEEDRRRREKLTHPDIQLYLPIIQGSGLNEIITLPASPDQSKAMRKHIRDAATLAGKRAVFEKDVPDGIAFKLRPLGVGRGGRRSFQPGRPPLPTGKKKQQMPVTVDSDVRKFVEEQRYPGEPVSVTVNRLLQELMDSSIKRNQRSHKPVSPPSEGSVE